MTPRFDAQRLAMLRDLWAAVRASSMDDVDRANELLAPYQGDLKKELRLTKELVEMASGLLSVADDLGLPAEELVQHVIERVPNEIRPAFERTGALILAVHLGTPEAADDMIVQDQREHADLARALRNYIAFLVRQVALESDITEAAFYQATAAQLASE